MSLARYRQKRSLDVTPEPRGFKVAATGHAFTVQEHAASRLHYDLRLKLYGGLKSYAVLKGPSLDPRDKRLAVQFEDRPVEYGEFKGIVPQGEYGDGTVMLWYRVEWQACECRSEGLRPTWMSLPSGR